MVRATFRNNADCNRQACYVSLSSLCGLVLVVQIPEVDRPRLCLALLWTPYDCICIDQLATPHITTRVTETGRLQSNVLRQSMHVMQVMGQRLLVESSD